MGKSARMFLSQPEIQELTGYHKPALQRRWLADHGWAFEIRADGQNVVLAEEARSRMLSRTTLKASRATEPDLAALRDLS